MNHVKPGDWLASLTSAERKEVAVSRGLFAYFPDALALIARHSVRSNEKHNPGQPVHWSREKSSDHEDCIARHSLAVATDPNSLDGDAPHIICRAWRALAALQVWVETNQAPQKQSCGTCKYLHKCVTESPCTSCSMIGRGTKNKWEAK